MNKNDFERVLFSPPTLERRRRRKSYACFFFFHHASVCACIYIYRAKRRESFWRERERAVTSSFSLFLFPIDDGEFGGFSDFFLTRVMMLFFREEIDPTRASNESFVCSSRGREIIIGGD